MGSILGVSKIFPERFFLSLARTVQLRKVDRTHPVLVRAVLQKSKGRTTVGLGSATTPLGVDTLGNFRLWLDVFAGDCSNAGVPPRLMDTS